MMELCWSPTYWLTSLQVSCAPDLGLHDSNRRSRYKGRYHGIVDLPTIAQHYKF